MIEGLNIVDLDRQAEMNRVSAQVHYNIAKSFDESDAEGTIKALVEKYPALVIKVLAKDHIHNLATLEAMDNFLKGWRS